METASVLPAEILTASYDMPAGSSITSIPSAGKGNWLYLDRLRLILKTHWRTSLGARKGKSVPGCFALWATPLVGNQRRIRSTAEDGVVGAWFFDVVYRQHDSAASLNIAHHSKHPTTPRPAPTHPYSRGSAAYWVLPPPSIANTNFLYTVVCDTAVNKDLFLFETMFYAPAQDTQHPTHHRLHVRDARDAHTVFEGVRQGVLKPVVRRLNEHERAKYIQSGSIFVWEESDDEMGLKRWTDNRGEFGSVAKHGEPGADFSPSCSVVTEPDARAVLILRRKDFDRRAASTDRPERQVSIPVSARKKMLRSERLMCAQIPIRRRSLANVDLVGSIPLRPQRQTPARAGETGVLCLGHRLCQRATTKMAFDGVFHVL